MQNLLAAYRFGDWSLYLVAVQVLLLVFRESEKINYLRYASWYMEMVYNLQETYPEIHDQFQKNHMFVMKTELGCVNAVALDMKLEQTIHGSKKEAVV